MSPLWKCVNIFRIWRSIYLYCILIFSYFAVSLYPDYYGISFENFLSLVSFCYAKSLCSRVPFVKDSVIATKRLKALWRKKKRKRLQSQFVSPHTRVPAREPTRGYELRHLIGTIRVRTKHLCETLFSNNVCNPTDHDHTYIHIYINFIHDNIQYFPVSNVLNWSPTPKCILSRTSPASLKSWNVT